MTSATRAYIEPPRRIPLLLRLGIRIAERTVGRELLAPRIMAWYPRAAIGAGVMEGLVAHSEGRATARLLKLVRLQVSFLASCAFCVDMNAAGLDAAQITDDEIEALQERRALEDIASFSAEESLALRYARALTATPVALDPDLLAALLESFSERELMVIGSTIAQVNFWTRMAQAIGVPPAGFSTQCALLRLDDYGHPTAHASEKNSGETKHGS